MLFLFWFLRMTARLLLFISRLKKETNTPVINFPSENMLWDRKGWRLDRCYRNLLAEMPFASCWEQVILFLFVLVEGPLQCPWEHLLAFPHPSLQVNQFCKRAIEQRPHVILWAGNLTMPVVSVCCGHLYQGVPPGIQVAHSTYFQGDLPLIETVKLLL